MNRFRALFLGFATAASAAALAAYNGAFDGPASAPAGTVTAKTADAAAKTADAPAETVAATPADVAAKTADAPAEAATADATAKLPDAAAKAADAAPQPAPEADSASGTADKPAADAAAAAPAASEDKSAADAANPDAKPVEVAKADPSAPAETPVEIKPAAPDAAAAKTDAPAAPPVVAPEFGLLRAEPDGSLLVAGKGAPNADIELVTGGTVLGKTKAEANGDFALVLNNPLKAGDYSMVLRTTNPDGSAATSVQTAIVAIPQDLSGEVLAMVEEPGKASHIITAPAAAKTAEAATTDAPAAAPAKEETVAAADPQASPAKTEAPEKIVIPLADVAVEAVEIEGSKIFVAGSAPAGSIIRIYATETLLGETKATENNRFLLEANRELAVGDYFIHADTIGPDGKLISRVTVPFTREAGENLAAVAAPEAPKAEEKQADAEPAKTPAAAATAKTPEPAAAEETAKADKPIAAAPADAAKAEEPAASAPQVSEAAPAAPEGQETAQADTQSAAAAAELSAAPETVAPALTKVDASVIIRRGDSLWRISRRIYGRGVRYSTIYLANKDKVTNPNRIWPGQVMMIPEKTSEGEAADMAEIEKRKKAAEAQ